MIHPDTTIPYPYTGVDLRGYEPAQVAESIAESYPGRATAPPEVPNAKPVLLHGEQVVARAEMHMLFAAFTRKNKANDDRAKKSRIKRQFRRVMCPVQILYGIKSGEPKLMDKPGFPDKEFDFREPSVLRFSPEDAGYLRERLVEMAEHAEDGEPLVTADAADYLDNLLGSDAEPGLLRRWRDVAETKAENVAAAAEEAAK